jgi:hypothetical protein
MDLFVEMDLLFFLFYVVAVSFSEVKVLEFKTQNLKKFDFKLNLLIHPSDSRIFFLYTTVSLLLSCTLR